VSNTARSIDMGMVRISSWGWIYRMTSAISNEEAPTLDSSLLSLMSFSIMRVEFRKITDRVKDTNNSLRIKRCRIYITC
jgi:hypothetical protein